MLHLWTRRVCALLILALAVAATPASAAEVLISIDPCRIFDTRVADGPKVPNDPALVGSPVTIQGNAACPAIPATGVTAVVANVIVVEPTDRGFISFFPQDVGFNGTSLLNFPVWDPVGNPVDAEFANDNGSILPLDADPTDGDLAFAWDTLPSSPQGTALAHVVIDVTGYFIELSVNTGGGFSKTDVYVNSQGGAAPAQGPYTRTASCSDGNDIALSGFCHSTGTDTSYLIGQNFTNYDTTATAASFTCDFESQGPNGNGQARIVCVNVPNP
jgi:hypothetical protein